MARFDITDCGVDMRPLRFEPTEDGAAALYDSGVRLRGLRDSSTNTLRWSFCWINLDVQYIWCDKYGMVFIFTC